MNRLLSGILWCSWGHRRSWRCRQLHRIDHGDLRDLGAEIMQAWNRDREIDRGRGLDRGGEIGEHLGTMRIAAEIVGADLEEAQRLEVGCDVEGERLRMRLEDGAEGLHRHQALLAVTVL